MKERPTPLTVIGTINITLGVLSLIGYIAIAAKIRAPDMFSAVAFGIFLPLLSIVLLFVSGFGVLARSATFGRYASIFYCAVVPISIFLPHIIYGKYEFPLGWMSFVSLIYPAALFYLVGYRYRSLFGGLAPGDAPGVKPPIP